jgi:galactose-6-phosphate isomerase
MPLLDVSDVLLDPEFMDLTLSVTRNAQTVGNDGIAVLSSTTTPFFGVVTSLNGSVLTRVAEGERISDTITIHTKFKLIDGQSGYDADVVNWQGLQWTVTNVNDYSTWGAGFVTATCTLKQLSG